MLGGSQMGAVVTCGFVGFNHSGRTFSVALEDDGHFDRRPECVVIAKAVARHNNRGAGLWVKVEIITISQDPRYLLPRIEPVTGGAGDLNSLLCQYNYRVSLLEQVSASGLGLFQFLQLITPGDAIEEQQVK